MAVFKCKMCGGNLEIGENQSIATCEYCGTEQTVSKSRDEIVSNLFSRANNLRIKCEFDKAERVYEKILDIDNTDSEAHWGIVLCKYGIEYVEDPKTYKRIPTCHRTIYEAVLTDVDFLAAIENADEKQKALYVSEARVIDKLQKNIINIVNNEEPFDVFICYKETDENGKRTIDSAITNDIYYQLTEEGFKVFYAPITLEDKLGHEYEPYIFAALNSAKVMLVVGTKPEYFDSVWVRNEWSRFLKTMKKDRSKLLVPCYRDMDVYELPDAFAHLQAQDMGKIGFINDLIRGLKKVFNRDVQQQSLSTKKQNVKKDRTREEKSFWEKLKNKFKVDYHLDFRFPKLTTSFFVFSIAYYICFLFKLCENVSDLEEILLYSTMGLSFIIPLLILTKVIKRKTTAIVLQILTLFSAIIYFSDAPLYAIEDGVFSSLVLISFLRIVWFVLVCSAKKVENKPKRKNKWHIEIISIVISIVITIIIEIFGITSMDYQLAKVLYKIGFYEYAYEYFVTLGDYEDCEELALKSKLNEIKNLDSTDVVQLGNWREGETIYDVEKANRWRVIDKTNDKVLLLRCFSSDFNEYGSPNVIGGWGDSSLRSFLNKEYYELSFSDGIKSRIVPTQLQNSSDSNDITTDKIFILSKEETEKYLQMDNYLGIDSATLRNVEGNTYTIYYDYDFLKFEYIDGKFVSSDDNQNINFEDTWEENRIRSEINSGTMEFQVAMWIDVSGIDIETESK